MQKVRVAIALPDLRGGGAERLHIHLARDWYARGMDVEFVLLRRQGDLLELLPDRIGVVDLAADRIRNSILPFAAYLRRKRPDIIVTGMWPLTSAVVMAWLLAGKRGRLYLSDHNQLSISCVQELGISENVVGFALRWTYPLANGVVAVSEGVKSDMCRIGRLPPSMIRVIYNPAATGATPDRAPLESRERLWGTGFSKHILSAGTLKTQKDHATLIEAFALLPLSVNAKLTILGEGVLRTKLEALVSRLGLQGRVSLPGFAIDPYPWFKSADLFVLSSRWEGFGNVIVEALECGLPIVSTDCASGPAEILGNGLYGRLVPVGDPRSLAEAMEKSLAELPTRDALVRRAKDFSVERISGQYLQYMGVEH